MTRPETSISRDLLTVELVLIATAAAIGTGCLISIVTQLWTNHRSSGGAAGPRRGRGSRRRGR